MRNDMYNLDNQSFVVLNFSTLRAFTDNIKNDDVTLQREAIVEIAAVKIKKGKIHGHYHSFVAIDGYNAQDIEFGSSDMGAYNLNNEHLIGAPAFKEVVEKLSDYVDDSVLIVYSLSPQAYNPFAIFKDCAKDCGYFFNNPAIAMTDIRNAKRLQRAVKESGIKFENANILQIAKMLAFDYKSWSEIFLDYGIFFDPDCDDIYDRDRNDPLSWALAFAKLFIKLVKWDNNTALKPIDEEPPF